MNTASSGRGKERESEREKEKGDKYHSSDERRGMMKQSCIIEATITRDQGFEPVRRTSAVASPSSSTHAFPVETFLSAMIEPQRRVVYRVCSACRRWHQPH